ncbi:hypothetical protein BC834DRAFT_969913 [Gloeopeniophorella convolvens]|nr:hypothetical protein BC834DRAFT_969913 [Gloeopeniophorella convolvens]
MGKWTSEYYDDVLGAKIKSLVSGAVKRSKLEKAEPSISYEAFVEDLDPGDSFTTTLTELLVREMAERRHRQASADRRLISDRTAKGLRTLAAPQRVYRDRGMRTLTSRRSLNLTDYLVIPPEEMELDDDNDSLGSTADPSGAAEGARMNSDLYDAYAHPGSSSTESHLASTTPQIRAMLRSAARHEDWGFMRASSPDGWGPPSPTAPPPAPALTRQPSIRRPPARSRTVDFTDFTSRRRPSTREGAGDADPDDSLPVPSWRPPTTSVPPRRFFPGPPRRMELPWGPAPVPESTSTSTSARASPAPPADTRDQRTFLSWLPSSALLSLPPPPSDLRGVRPQPRLRRGGVRPPESLLSRPHVMLRTESPEPDPSMVASAGVGTEGDMPPLVDAPTEPPRGLSPAPAPTE